MDDTQDLKRVFYFQDATQNGNPEPNSTTDDAKDKEDEMQKNRPIIPAVFGPVPDREYHEGFMREAINMAQLALTSDETPVGCVFVQNGQIIGRGINGTNASLNVRPSINPSTTTPNHLSTPR